MEIASGMSCRELGILKVSAWKTSGCFELGLVIVEELAAVTCW